MQIDLLPTEEAIEAVEASILAHNSEVDIMRTSHCSLPISHILNKAAFAGSSHPSSQLTQLQAMQVSAPVHSSHGMSKQDAQAIPQPSTASAQGHKASHAVSEASTADAHGQGHPQSLHDSQGAAQSTGQQHSAGTAGGVAQASAHASTSHEGHGLHQGHHSHGHSHHLDTVKSISLVKQGQVDLARYTSLPSLVAQWFAHRM